MITEKSPYKLLIKNLISLGYPESSIRTDVKTLYGKQIDLVIYELDKPKIAFEIKGSVRYSSIDPTSVIEEKVKFNPTVKQAQLLAQEINAPYFAVSDGIAILWFDIDQEDGQPRLLDGPVLARVQAYQNTENSKAQILRVLFDLADISRGHLDLQESAIRVGMAVLARLLTEKGSADLEVLLITSDLELKSFDSVFSELDNHKNIDDKDFYSKAFFTLDKINLLNIPPSDFINAIDNFIYFVIDKARYGVFKLPNWISELMMYLMHIDSDDSVLDIYSNFGDSVATLRKQTQRTELLVLLQIQFRIFGTKLRE